MRANSRLGWGTLVLPLAACGLLPGERSAVPFSQHFDYIVADRDRLQLVQVFDDGASTYLQFADTVSGSLEIRSPTSAVALTYAIEPHYVVVAGVYGALRVRTGDAWVSITNRHPVLPAGSPSRDAQRPDPAAKSYAVTPSAAPAGVNDQPKAAYRASGPSASATAPASVGIPESLQTMNPMLRVATLNREIAELEARARLLEEALAEAHRTGSGAMLVLRQGARLPRITVNFDDYSAQVKIEEPLLGALGSTARAANRIYLHGHTDAFAASPTATDLAIRRAVAVRKVLVSLDVEPARIRLFYRGAGHFIANNSTREGKAQNRRVDIELRKW